MDLDSQPKSSQECLPFSWPAPFRFVVILLLFAAAFGVRLYHIDRPPLDISPIRQYQNAHIARGIFYETNESISEGKKHIAKINMERMGFVLEPRIIENAAVLGYRLSGAERLWIPRALSSIFWIVGGIFLYLTARMFFPYAVSLFSTFFYLFLPFSILSSRLFQPDPLMVMMMLFGVFMVLKYDENPSLTNLVFSAIITAMAVLIKPYCVFIIFGAFYSLAVLRMGFWKASFDRNTIMYGLLIILPTIVYYFFNFLVSGGFLAEHAKGSFLPHLLVSLPFWRGWLTMIGQVVGYIPFFLALLGLLMVKAGRPKALLTGLWVGYFIFGVSATFQIHTHHYYTMPFIPIVALSLAPIASAVMNRLTSLSSAPIKIFVIILLFFVIISVIGFNVSRDQLKNIFSDYKYELRTAAIFIGVTPEFSRFLVDDSREKLRIAKEIGEHVGHSTNTLFLTPEFGRVLAYHGEFAGLPWPTSSSLYARSVRGERGPDLEKDFSPGHITLLYQGKFIEYVPDFFIITAFNEFEKQADLKKLLYNNFPVIVRNDHYLIFDLRKMSE